MFGIVTTLEGLHVTGKYRDRSMQHTCSKHAAWDAHIPSLATHTLHPEPSNLNPQVKSLKPKTSPYTLHRREKIYSVRLLVQGRDSVAVLPPLQSHVETLIIYQFRSRKFNIQNDL